jgi:leader peptidase (prepilin peptidase) / N-methyltransferase
MPVLIDLPRGIAALIIFTFGACVGSFANVVAYRLPRGISIVAPRSFCPNCGSAVPLWANVPILAYLGLRARCSVCGGRIAFRYLLTELALASAAAYLYLKFAPLDALARYVLCTALFIVALIDYDWRVIPNVITFPGIPLGMLSAWLLMPEVGWKSSLGGVAVGAGFLFITGEAYMRIRGREGVGMGDVWLLGMVGAFLGWPGAVFTLFVGSIMGTVGAVATAIGGGDPPVPSEAVPIPVSEVMVNTAPAVAPPRLLQTEIPFAPFLALAAGTFALFQPALISWYMR